MKTFYTRFYSFYKKIKNKIIFYPSLFAVSGVLFAFFMMFLEQRGISRYLVDNVPILVVNNGDTALTILSACITGLISMMVFSFSMVMILLNQASSNYSPRLLPGLISDQNHQIILGIYLSSILYCIFILFSIQPTGDKYQIPGFSVLLGILFTVACIYAFIYFIHNISQNIQITYILDKTFLSAKSTLKKLLEHEHNPSGTFPDTQDWPEYHTEKSGYFQDYSTAYLLDFCKEKEVKIHILPVKGIFVLQGIPVLKCSRKLNEDEVKDLLARLRFSRSELVSENYVLAFKQITEVIVKAMSPGINDPGTALNAIDYLTELLRLRMQKSDETFISDDNIHYIKVRSVNFEELLYNVMAAIRTYCKKDIVVIQKLGTMFYFLKSQKVQNKKFYKVLNQEAKRMLEDAESVLENRADLAVLNRISERLDLHSENKTA